MLKDAVKLTLTNGLKVTLKIKDIISVADYDTDEFTIKIVGGETLKVHASEELMKELFSRRVSLKEAQEILARRNAH